jgi:hypothetical protein
MRSIPRHLGSLIYQLSYTFRAPKPACHRPLQDAYRQPSANGSKEVNTGHPVSLGLKAKSKGRGGTAVLLQIGFSTRITQCRVSCIGMYTPWYESSSPVSRDGEPFVSLVEGPGGMGSVRRREGRWGGIVDGEREEGRDRGEDEKEGGVGDVEACPPYTRCGTSA